MENTNRISFHFHPYKHDEGLHVVEREEGGFKRKYLKGISSGIKRDGHFERMTIECVKSMHDQGTSGNVLLYSGLHGVDFTDDIGILVNSIVNENGDWETTYRLYDESDNIGTETIEKVNKLWKQINGLPPYKKPIQKGFSIEGIVPENQIIDKVVNPDGSYSQRVINDIHLDGVVVVSRPAYQDSVVTAVYKFLGELPPEGRQKIKKDFIGLLQERLDNEESRNNFYKQFFNINGILEDKIHDVMKIDDVRNRERLELLFDEYKNVTIGLILQHADIFRAEPTTDSGDVQLSRSADVDRILKSIAAFSKQLSTSLLKRIGDKNAKCKQDAKPRGNDIT